MQPVRQKLFQGHSSSWRLERHCPLWLNFDSIPLFELCDLGDQGRQGSPEQEEGCLQEQGQERDEESSD